MRKAVLLAIGSACLVPAILIPRGHGSAPKTERPR
jgi:hypothetical protein